MAVPSVPSHVAWYSPGPAPGEPGDAVIDGHLDWTTGPAVFWNLGKLHAGGRDPGRGAGRRGPALQRHPRGARAVHVTAGRPVLHQRIGSPVAHHVRRLLGRGQEDVPAAAGRGRRPAVSGGGVLDDDLRRAARAGGAGARPSNLDRALAARHARPPPCEARWSPRRARSRTGGVAGSCTSDRLAMGVVAGSDAELGTLAPQTRPRPGRRR